MLVSVSFGRLSAQLCTPDTSLHKAGYRPAKLPVVKADSQYNESLSVLVKRDTFRMVGPTKVNVKIDSVKATSVLGLPVGYNYECQHPRCVFLWDTVKCVRIFGKTSIGGTYPILIPVIGYAKIGSSSFTQKDTIREFTLIVEGGLSGLNNAIKLNGWMANPNPAKESIQIYSEHHYAKNDWKLIDACGKEINILFDGENGIYSANIAGLLPGIYFIRNGNQVKKIIVSGN